MSFYAPSRGIEKCFVSTFRAPSSAAYTARDGTTAKFNSTCSRRVGNSQNLPECVGISRHREAYLWTRRAASATKPKQAYCVKPLTMLAPSPAVQVWLTSSLLLSNAALGLVLESTAVGAALSAPLITMFASLLLSNVGLLPASSAIYGGVTSYLVPLAVPLLLFSADLKRAIVDTGMLLRAFLVGTVGTLAGTLVAWHLVPLQSSLGAADAWKIAVALCARHIGGAVNYVATAEATGAGPAAVAAGLAADNLIVALYFLLLFVLARKVVYRPPRLTSASAAGGVEVKTELEDVNTLDDSIDSSPPIRIVDMSVAIGLSSSICALGTFIAASYVPQLGAIPVITALVVMLATLFPKQFRPLCSAGSGIGIFLMQIFFAAIGASGSFVAVLKTAPALFVFSTVQLAVHLVVVLFVGRVLLRLKLEELLLASNANVGGPTTAAGMAAAKNWQELIVPCLLVGVFGYGVATFLSLGLGHAFLKPHALRAIR